MDQLISKIIEGVIQPFVIFLSGLTLLIFFYGIVEFIAGADNEMKRAKGKSHLLWGLVGLFIMVAVYSIIAVIKNFIGTLE